VTLYRASEISSVIIKSQSASCDWKNGERYFYGLWANLYNSQLVKG